MTGKYSFNLRSRDKKRDLPDKLIIGRNSTETLTRVVLKFFAYVLFYRERLQIETNLHIDSIPYIPDVVQLDYELRPALWVECGECSVAKLDKPAVKVPDAELWVMKRSVEDANDLRAAMEKADLRRNRYNVAGLDSEMFDETCGLLQTRNQILWVSGSFDPPNLQFDFNGLWFDAPFTVIRF